MSHRGLGLQRKSLEVAGDTIQTLTRSAEFQFKDVLDVDAGDSSTSW